MVDVEYGGRTPVHRIQPLEDSRWAEFLERHPRASVFHSVAWLEALRRTYGYEPLAFTTSPAGDDLRNALVLCRVESWLTGRRLVSLPFSDHCEPLVDEAADRRAILAALEHELIQKKLLYIEIRPLGAFDTSRAFHSNCAYCFHELDLRPDLGTLFKNCHKDSTQRKIRRAERENLTYEEGRSASLLKAFHCLLLPTRRRHHVPPQPIRWFQNLIDCFGEALKIRVAFKDQRPVAAILTLRYKDTLVYKYGCSDVRFNQFGGMHLLLWRSIQEAKRDGLRAFDLGRSNCDNTGLTTFKERWGGVRAPLTYVRFAGSVHSKAKFSTSGEDWKERIAKGVLSHLPDCVLYSVGDLIYKHMG